MSNRDNFGNYNRNEDNFIRKRNRTNDDKNYNRSEGKYRDYKDYKDSYDYSNRSNKNDYNCNSNSNSNNDYRRENKFESYNSSKNSNTNYYNRDSNKSYYNKTNYKDNYYDKNKNNNYNNKDDYRNEDKMLDLNEPRRKSKFSDHPQTKHENNITSSRSNYERKPWHSPPTPMILNESKGYNMEIDDHSEHSRNIEKKSPINNMNWSTVISNHQNKIEIENTLEKKDKTTVKQPSESNLKGNINFPINALTIMLMNRGAKQKEMVQKLSNHNVSNFNLIQAEREKFTSLIKDQSKENLTYDEMFNANNYPSSLKKIYDTKPQKNNFEKDLAYYTNKSEAISKQIKSINEEIHKLTFKKNIITIQCNELRASLDEIFSEF